MKKLIVVLSLVVVLTGFSSQCFALHWRYSPWFGSNFHHFGIEDIGVYKYGGGRGDKVGMLYTCKGGYIDLGHLKECTDRTKYAYDIIYENILKDNQKEFSFKIVDKAVYFVTIYYPANWKSMKKNDKQKIARIVSANLGERVAYCSTVWHEIITRLGYSSFMFSERPSAFSWEDLYSDLVGSNLAAQALKSGEDFEKQMTKLIPMKLKELRVQPAEIARQATDKIKDKWFAGIYPGIRMKRNFDIGFDDGFITPWLVPGICSNSQSVSEPVSSLNDVSNNGFSFNLEMRPKSRQGKKAFGFISNDIDGKRLQPGIDFLKIVEHLRKEEIRKHGNGIDTPSLGFE